MWAKENIHSEYMTIYTEVISISPYRQIDDFPLHLPDYYTPKCELYSKRNYKPAPFALKTKLCGYLILLLFAFFLLHVPLGITTFSFPCISCVCVFSKQNKLTAHWHENVELRNLENIWQNYEKQHIKSTDEGTTGGLVGMNTKTQNSRAGIFTITDTQSGKTR